MHPNAQTLQRFYTAFAQLDHATMAACYAPDAQFDDEAFSLKGRDQIGGMWRMLCTATRRLDGDRAAVRQQTLAWACARLHALLQAPPPAPR